MYKEPEFPVFGLILGVFRSFSAESRSPAGSRFPVNRGRVMVCLAENMAEFFMKQRLA
jgi:hypothetical protein